MGGFHPSGAGGDTCHSTISLQESLNEFAELQQKVAMEHELSRAGTSPAKEESTIGFPPSGTASSSESTMTNVLSSLTPYPPNAGEEKAKEILGGGVIIEEPDAEVSKIGTTPLLRKVLEEQSFEQKYGLKTLDFLIGQNVHGCMGGSVGIDSVIDTIPRGGQEACSGKGSISRPESFQKPDVESGISGHHVIFTCLDQVKKDILTTCEILSISPGKHSKFCSLLLLRLFLRISFLSAACA